MSWDGVKKGAGAGLPEPPKAADLTLQVVSRPDGRTARATGRTKQFNPKVRPQFMERFAEAQAREEEELGERVTSGLFSRTPARTVRERSRQVGSALWPLRSRLGWRGIDRREDEVGPEPRGRGRHSRAVPGTGFDQVQPQKEHMIRVGESKQAELTATSRRPKFNVSWDGWEAGK